MIHHRDQEIEEHDDVDDREAAEHDETPEPGKLFDSCQLKVVQVYQTKRGPEQGLSCLPQTKKRNIGMLSEWKFKASLNLKSVLNLLL